MSQSASVLSQHIVPLRSRATLRRRLAVSLVALLIGATGCKKKDEDAGAPSQASPAVEAAVPGTAPGTAPSTAPSTAPAEAAPSADPPSADAPSHTVLPPGEAKQLHGHWITDNDATTALFESHGEGLLDDVMNAAIARYVVLGMRFDPDGVFDRRFAFLQETDASENTYDVYEIEDNTITIGLPLDPREDDGERGTMHGIFSSPDVLQFGPAPDGSLSEEEIMIQTVVFKRTTAAGIEAALEKAKDDPTIEEFFSEK